MLASLFSKKASFAGFQALEFPSGVEATPTSPMAPARESGLTKRIGTAVVTTLYSTQPSSADDGDNRLTTLTAAAAAS